MSDHPTITTFITPVTHPMANNQKLKRMVLEHVLMTRDARSVPDRKALPTCWSTDEFIDNYFMKSPTNTSDVDVVVGQHGNLNLIDMGHYGVRIQLNTADEDMHAKKMRANASFKKFEYLCKKATNLGMSASIYSLTDSNLKQMSLVLEDTQSGKMWLFDHVHENVDGLITEMYDRLCVWLYHHNLVNMVGYLTVYFKLFESNNPLPEPVVE